MKPLRVLLIAVAGLLASCSDIQDLDTVRSLDRLPLGSPERLRILAPTQPAVGDGIVSVRVERLAYEGDALGPNLARSRCVVVRVAGPARFIDFAASGETLVTVPEVEFLLDRGQVRTLGVIGTDAGTALVWARLLNSACPEPDGATSLAESSRSLRFERGSQLPTEGL